MPLPFYNLPAELREIIWSEAVGSLDGGVPGSIFEDDASITNDTADIDANFTGNDSASSGGSINNNNSNTRCAYLTEDGDGSVIRPSEAMVWLQTVSLVSRRFSADGRRHFFATFKHFSLRDKCVMQARRRAREKQPPTYANLRRFLHCVGAADARHIRSIDVRYCHDRPRFSIAAAGSALNAMGVQRWTGLRGVEVRVWFYVDAREGDAAFQFRVDDRGKFSNVNILWP